MFAPKFSKVRYIDSSQEFDNQNAQCQKRKNTKNSFFQPQRNRAITLYAARFQNMWEMSFKNNCKLNCEKEAFVRDVLQNCELKLWKRSYRTRLFLYKLQVLLSWSLSSSRLFCGLSSLQLHSALLSFLNFRTMEVSLLNFLWTIVTVGPSRVEYSTSAPKCDLEIGSLTLQLTLHPSIHHSAVR